MREHKEDWNKQLETVVIEIAGLQEIFYTNPAFLQLLCKLEGLRMVETDFETYRRTIFETLSLMQDIKGEVTDE